MACGGRAQNRAALPSALLSPSRSHRTVVGLDARKRYPQPGLQDLQRIPPGDHKISPAYRAQTLETVLRPNQRQFPRDPPRRFSGYRLAGVYSPQDHAGRVGSCAGNSRFKGCAKRSVPTKGGKRGPSWGWFEDMRLGNADSLHRLESSNFCWDAHRWGADRFVYYVLELVPHLNVADRRCLEQKYMDALRDQTDLEDYTGQSACPCPLHPAPRKYWRRKTRPRAATWQ